MSKLVYLAHYDVPNGGRCTSPAGTTVMEYVIDCLKRAKQETVVLSPAMSRQTLPYQELDLGETARAVLLPTERSPKRWQLVSHLLRKWRQQRRLIRALLTQVDDGDTLLVYHSLSFMNAIKKLLKHRKITLVLQVCEIYADVTENERIKKRELNFFQLADRYVFQSETLNELINVRNLPYTVLYGTYRTVDDHTATHPLVDRTQDTIHCVYAGTLDPRKGGGATAVKAAQYLSEQYHMHILGFGTDTQVRQMKELVAEVSSRCQCTVTYDGCLSGREYLDFIGNCHIGMSTQQPDAAYNATSFPSKILTYMANGLRVITARIPNVEASQVGNNLFYYDESTPESIAKAIQAIDLTDEYDGKRVIRQLDNAFFNSFCRLIENQQL